MESTIEKDKEKCGERWYRWLKVFLHWLKYRTFGKLNTGLYYQKKREYLTNYSVAASVIGAIGFFGIIVWVLIQIVTYQIINT
jgi:hypothetical protein